MFPFLSPLTFLYQLFWRKEDGDFCGCILTSSKVYMAQKVECTLGEMGVQTFEIH